MILSYMSTVRGNATDCQHRATWQQDDLKSSQAQRWKESLYINWKQSAARRHRHRRSDSERSSHRRKVSHVSAFKSTLSWHLRCEATSRALLPGARELSESCVSQNSGSLLTEQPCVLSQDGGSVRGCHPREIFVNYGQICILSHFLAKMTCKTTCSRTRGHASGQNFLHIHVWCLWCGTH